MKNLDFTLVDNNANNKKMSLVINKAEKPYIMYNNQKYEGYRPREVFLSELIKNPTPLPKGTYGFEVDGVVILFESSLFTGNTFLVVNKGYAIKDYKGKNRAVKIVKGIVCVVAVLIVILSILMFI